MQNESTRENPHADNSSLDLAATAPGQLRVIKRNGTVVPYTDDKITVAITKAFLAVEGNSASASSRTPTSRALQADLQRLALDYDDAHTYHTSGSKRSKGAALSHRQQRDTSSSYRGGSYKAGKASKGGMAACWGYARSEAQPYPTRDARGRFARSA